MSRLQPLAGEQVTEHKRIALMRRRDCQLLGVPWYSWGMSETTKWDAYVARASRYLETHDIESEELRYKRETESELSRYRVQVLSQRSPISIKPNGNLKNLGGFRKFPDFLKWLSTEDGSGTLRGLWAPYNRGQTSVPDLGTVIERVRRFGSRLPKGILSGIGTRTRPISVLLMALGADQYPVL